MGEEITREGFSERREGVLSPPWVNTGSLVRVTEVRKTETSMEWGVAVGDGVFTLLASWSGWERACKIWGSLTGTWRPLFLSELSRKCLLWGKYYERWLLFWNLGSLLHGWDVRSFGVLWQSNTCLKGYISISKQMNSKDERILQFKKAWDSVGNGIRIACILSCECGWDQYTHSHLCSLHFNAI